MASVGCVCVLVWMGVPLLSELENEKAAELLMPIQIVECFIWTNNQGVVFY